MKIKATSLGYAVDLFQFLIVVIPATIVVIIVWLAKQWLAKKLEFKPKQRFFELTAVKLVVVIGYFAVVVSSALIFSTGNYSFEPSSVGFNSVIAEFKYPLGVVTLMLAILGLMAANHRSVQTADQIRVTEEHNRFTCYYNHLEHLRSYLKDEGIAVKTYSNYEVHKIEHDSVAVASISKLHEFFFGKIENWDVAISKEASEKVSEYANQVKLKLELYKVNYEIGCNDSLKKSMLRKYLVWAYLFSNSLASDTGLEMGNKGKFSYTNFKKLDELSYDDVIPHIKNLMKTINRILQFTSDVKLIKQFETLSMMIYSSNSKYEPIDFNQQCPFVLYSEVFDESD